YLFLCFFLSSRRRHTRSKRDWSSDVCSSDLLRLFLAEHVLFADPIPSSAHHIRELVYPESVLVQRQSAAVLLQKNAFPFHPFGYEYLLVIFQSFLISVPDLKPL